MIEDAMGSGHIRQVGQKITGTDLDLPVDHVTGVSEQDVVDQFQFVEQNGACDTIEVSPGHEPVFERNHSLM